MRSSTILTLFGATLAVATPLHKALHAAHAKKAYAYEVVTDIVYVTVTEGELPSTSSTQDPQTVVVSHTVYAQYPEPEPSSSSSSSTPVPTTSSSIYVAPPPPTTSSTPPTTTNAPPAPTTTSEAPVPTTTDAPIVAIVTQAAAAVASAIPAPAASSSSSTSSLSDMASQAVSSHNTCRSSHSAPSLTYNATLAQWAANTAATCVWGHDMSQGGGGYGQNIAAQGSSDMNAWTAQTAVQNAIIDEWYSEQSLFASFYGQASPSSTSDFLHFTQVVWKSSESVGCAVQACPTSNSIFPGDYTWFTVCNYYPAGNVSPLFSENVLAS